MFLDSGREAQESAKIQHQVEIIGEDKYVYVPSQQTINRLHCRDTRF